MWWHSLHLLPCLYRAAFHFWHTEHLNYRRRDARQGQAQQHTQTAASQRAVAGTHGQQVVQWSIRMRTLVELDICQRRWMDDLHPCWHEQGRRASQPSEHTNRGAAAGRSHTHALTAGGAPLHALLHGL